MKNLLRLTAVIMFAGMIFGCHDADYYRQERLKKAKKHFEEISRRIPEEGRVFTLVDCIGIAIEHNLDLKVFDIKEKIANERTTAEMLGMLPELNISYDISGRNNDPGSSSTNIKTGERTYAPSNSTDRIVGTFKVELALSVIDFGLAYLNATQAEDQALIAIEQKRRAAQNLKLEVARTYFKVAATQDARDTSQQLLDRCKEIDKVLSELEKSKTISVFRILDERRRFIRLQKQLMEYQRSYDNACIELRSLMGFLPVKEVRVDTTFLSDIRIQDLPNVDTLEKVALVERPELYQLDIQTNIAINEARKAILLMLPHVRAFIDFTNSNNSFLYNQSWWEVAARAAYNLLKLPQQIARYRMHSTEVKELDARVLALSIGVMSQVRIAHSNMKEVEERYHLDNQVYESYAKHLDAARKNYSSGGSQSQLDLARYELETTDTQIARTIALGNYYLAYYQLLNTVGVETLNKKYIDDIINKINMSDAKAAAKSAKDQKSMDAAAKDMANMYNGVQLGNNTMQDNTRAKADTIGQPGVANM